MLRITKSEPDYFIEAKQRVVAPNVSEAWGDANIANIRAQLRREILGQEQNFLCAYCEKKIDDNQDNSNIDHFKTRTLFPSQTLEYNNMLVSCNSKASCSYIKDNYGLQQDDYRKIINPAMENPDNYFEYGLAGDILIKQNLTQSDKEKAEFTIKVFSLNHKSLVDKRKSIVPSLQSYKEQDFEIDEIFEYLPDYKTFVVDIYSKIEGAAT